MKDVKLLEIYKPIFGMIHLEALPGTPDYSGDVKSIISKAKKEAEIYKESGIDAVIIENMHDVPYLKRKVGPEIGPAHGNRIAVCMDDGGIRKRF